jgi:hypothetical protein
MKLSEVVSAFAQLFVLIMLSVAAITAAEKKPLTNDDVRKMIKAELPDSTIVLTIQNSPSSFDTSPEGLIALKSAGVGMTVIEAMVVAGSQPKDKTPEVPTEGDVEKSLSRIAAAQSDGMASLISLKKTDGQRMFKSGVHLYKMRFDALVRFNDDGVWLHVHLVSDLKFNTARRPRTFNAGMEEMLFYVTNPGLRVQRGSVYLVKGVAVVEKTENGWNPVELSHEGVEVSSAAAIAKVEGDKNKGRLGDVASLSREALAKLVETAVPSPEVADQKFTSKNGKVTSVCPAGFKIEMGGTDIVGRFVSAEGGKMADAINVTCGTTALFNRKQPLEDAVKRTIASIRSAYRGADVTESVKTKLAGVEAETFVATVIESGAPKRKAFTVAVAENHILGVVLHSTPERFAEAWNAYKRVCEAYVLTVK